MAAECNTSLAETFCPVHGYLPCVEPENLCGHQGHCACIKQEDHESVHRCRHAVWSQPPTPIDVALDNFDASLTVTDGIRSVFAARFAMERVEAFLRNDNEIKTPRRLARYEELRFWFFHSVSPTSMERLKPVEIETLQRAFG